MCNSILLVTVRNYILLLLLLLYTQSPVGFLAAAVGTKRCNIVINVVFYIFFIPFAWCVFVSHRSLFVFFSFGFLFFFFFYFLRVYTCSRVFCLIYLYSLRAYLLQRSLRVIDKTVIRFSKMTPRVTRGLCRVHLSNIFLYYFTSNTAGRVHALRPAVNLTTRLQLRSKLFLIKKISWIFRCKSHWKTA